MNIRSLPEGVNGCLFLFADVGRGCLGGGESLCDLESDVVNCCLIEDSEFGFYLLDDFLRRGFFLGVMTKLRPRVITLCSTVLSLCLLRLIIVLLLGRQRLLNFLICLALVDMKGFLCCAVYMLKELTLVKSSWLNRSERCDSDEVMCCSTFF